MRLKEGDAYRMAMGSAVAVTAALATALAWWVIKYVVGGELNFTNALYGLGVFFLGSTLIVMISIWAVAKPLHNWLKKYEIGGS